MITPDFSQVLERCQIEQANPDLPETATVAPHLALFLLQWVETFPNDFIRQAMMDKLHEALRFCKNLDPSCSRGCDRLIRLLDNRLVDVKSKKKVPKSDCLEKLDFVSLPIQQFIFTFLHPFSKQLYLWF